jgi:pectin methylesterase-like acyl-CoA thioesterase
MAKDGQNTPIQDAFNPHIEWVSVDNSFMEARVRAAGLDYDRFLAAVEAAKKEQEEAARQIRAKCAATFGETFGPCLYPKCSCITIPVEVGTKL